MHARPSYSQLRYIGVADGGRELVRVNQVNGAPVVVATNALQQKAGEFYFQAAMSIDADRAFLSNVTLNREFGVVDPREVPTIRLLVPVHNGLGELFGFIVINVDYEDLLRTAVASTPLTDGVLVSNQNGDYLYANSGRALIHFAFHQDRTYQPHPLIGAADGLQGTAIGEADGSIFAARQIQLPEIETALDLRVTVMRDATLVNAAALQSLPVIIASSLILVLISLGVTIWVINRVMRPFQSLSTRIESAASVAEIKDLPVERRDEVGTLARAFSDVTAGLVNSEAQTSAVIDGVVDVLIVIDETGRIERFNPACEHIFGYHGDELLGANVRQLMPSDYAKHHDTFLANYRAGKPAQIIGIGREVVGLRKDGSTFPLDLSVSEINLPGRRLYCGIVRDISERKQMERMKDEFISTVNHEIRTPLTSLVGSLSLLRVKAKGRLDSKGDKLLELAQASGERLSVLVNDILDLEKMAAGKLEYDMQPADLTELVEAVINQSGGLEERHGVSFQLAASTGPILVNLDRNRFHQALGNLLSNAAKFSPRGEIVQIRVARETGRPQRVQITVEDRGPGIPEEFRDSIFERFSQADSSTTRVEGSSGLGLNITKTLIEAFDGEVKFDSVVGEGTRFHFYLPVLDASGDRDEGPNAKAAGANSLS